MFYFDFISLKVHKINFIKLLELSNFEKIIQASYSYPHRLSIQNPFINLFGQALIWQLDLICSSYLS